MGFAAFLLEGLAGSVGAVRVHRQVVDSGFVDFSGYGINLLNFRVAFWTLKPKPEEGESLALC